MDYSEKRGRRRRCERGCARRRGCRSVVPLTAAPSGGQIEVGLPDAFDLAPVQAALAAAGAALKEAITALTQQPKDKGAVAAYEEALKAWSEALSAAQASVALRIAIPIVLVVAARKVAWTRGWRKHLDHVHI